MSAETRLPETTGVAHERARLDRALAHGVMWLGLAKWAAQLFSWTAMIVVARILSPSDFGIWGMATLYLGFVTLVSEFGMDAAVVTLRDLSDNVLRQLNSVAVLLGLAAFVLSFGVAPLLARFFGAPELTWVVIAMSVTFIVTGFRVIPLAMLQRGLRFRGIAMADTAQATILAAASVMFATLGFRYWTLVLSAAIGSLLSTTLVLAQARTGFATPRWEELRSALSFSRNTIVSRMAWALYDDSDFLVAGKVLGKEPLGFYSLAWQLATAIHEKVTSLVGKVTPSVLSASQRDPAALRRYLLSVTEAISLLTMPASVGLALVSHDIVTVVFGAKWLSAIGPLRMLALYVSFRSISPFFGQVLMVTGQTARAMRISLTGLVVFPLAFLVGSRWGITGIATTWILVHPVVIALPAARAAFKQIGLTAREYFQSLVPATTSVAVMCLVVLLGRVLRPTSVAPLASLAVDVLTGVLAFALALLGMHRHRVTRLWNFARANLPSKKDR